LPSPGRPDSADSGGETGSARRLCVASAIVKPRPDRHDSEVAGFALTGL
jgi:hypothetical protein